MNRLRSDTPVRIVEDHDGTWEGHEPDTGPIPQRIVAERGPVLFVCWTSDMHHTRIDDGNWRRATRQADGSIETGGIVEVTTRRELDDALRAHRRAKA